MTLEKAIASGKEHRKARRKMDWSCYDRTPRKGCPWCQGNRTYQGRKAEAAARAELKESLEATWHHLPTT